MRLHRDGRYETGGIEAHSVVIDALWDDPPADARRQLLGRLGPEAQHHFTEGCQMARRELLDHCLAL